MYGTGEKGMEFWDRMATASQGECPDCGSRLEGTPWDKLGEKASKSKGECLWRCTGNLCSFACYIGEGIANVGLFGGLEYIDS
jgi:hypothetical protein